MSNSSDALDKNRYESITDPGNIQTPPKLYITIAPGTTHFTVTIEDLGVGMASNELVTFSIQIQLRMEFVVGD